MKFDWRVELPALLLLGSMFVAAALAWGTAPERLPVHWNLSGEVDRYGGRFEGLLGMPLLTLGLYVLLLLLPRLDPGRANYATFAGAYGVLRLTLVVFFVSLYTLMLLVFRGHRVSMQTALPLLLGALFVVLGGVLGKIRPNWFVGIRTPWTLSSKAAWTRTHRLGGWLFVLSGITVMASIPAGFPWTIVVLIASTAVTVLVSVVYSYVVWRNDPDKIPPAGSLPA